MVGNIRRHIQQAHKNIKGKEMDWLVRFFKERAGDSLTIDHDQEQGSYLEPTLRA